MENQDIRRRSVGIILLAQALTTSVSAQIGELFTTRSAHTSTSGLQQQNRTIETKTIEGILSPIYFTITDQLGNEHPVMVDRLEHTSIYKNKHMQDNISFRVHYKNQATFITLQVKSEQIQQIHVRFENKVMNKKSFSLNRKDYKNLPDTNSAIYATIVEHMAHLDPNTIKTLKEQTALKEFLLSQKDDCIKNFSHTRDIVRKQLNKNPYASQNK